MKWIVYSAVIVNQVTRLSTQQVRRAPVMHGEDAAVTAEQLGGTLLAVHTDVRKAEGLRRLTELQAILAGYPVAEWTPPAEWERETERSLPKPRMSDRGSRFGYPRLAAN